MTESRHKTESRQTELERLIRSLHQEIKRQQRELQPLERARRELQRELRRLARRNRLENTGPISPGAKTDRPESATCDAKVIGDMGADAVELDQEIERRQTRINVLIDVLDLLLASQACREDGALEDGAPAAAPRYPTARDTPAITPATGLGRLPGRLLQFPADRSKDR